MKDVLLGRIFGLGALLRAGLATASADVAAGVAEQLLSLAAQRSFLREVATAVLLELLDACPDAALEAALARCAALRAALHAPPEEASAEGLLLALRLWPRLRGDVRRGCALLPPADAPAPPRDAYSGAANAGAVARSAAAFFARPHLEAIAPVLVATTHAHPRMHLAWLHVLALLLPGFSVARAERAATAAAAAPAEGDAADGGAAAGEGKKGKHGKKGAAAAAAAGGASASGAAAAEPAAAPRPPPERAHLEALWGVVVEGGLLASSHERRFLALQLFQVLLPHLSAGTVAVVLSPALLHTLAVSLAARDSYLHAGARKTLERLVAHVERSGRGDLRLAVVLALQRASFDASSKTKTAARLLQGLDAAALGGYVAQLEAAFLGNAPLREEGEGGGGAGPASAAAAANGGHKGKAKGGKAAAAGGDEAAGAEVNEAPRRWALEQLVAAARLPAATEALRLRALRFLAAHAFFDVSAGAVAAGATAATPGKGKAKGGKAAAAGGGRWPEELRSAAAAAPLSAAIRQQCASRLLSLVGAMSHAPPAPAAPPAAANGAGGDKAAAAAAAAAAAKHRDPQAAERLLQSLMAFVRDCLASSPAPPLARPLPEAAAPALASLGEVEATVAALGGGDRAAAGRVRAVLALVRLLQLHLLAAPEAFDVAVRFLFVCFGGVRRQG